MNKLFFVTVNSIILLSFTVPHGKGLRAHFLFLHYKGSNVIMKKKTER